MMVPPEAEIVCGTPKIIFLVLHLPEFLANKDVAIYYLNQKLFVVPKPGKRVLFFCFV
jgi:hypothetical protein